jgi:hypothetical protein
MPIHVACDACGSRLKAPDQLAGRKVKCPKCGAMLAVPGGAEEETEPAPPPQPKKAPAHAVTARKRTAAEETPPPEPEGPTESEEPDDEDRPRRKKKKRRHRKHKESSTPPWVGWLTGGLIAFVVVAVLVTVLVAAWQHPEIMALAAVFGVMLVISTGILVLSMFISSAIVGGMEFGEAHVVIPKAMGLLCVVNMVSVVLFYISPCFGPFVALPVWLFGCMIVFKLDLWEARVLVAVNWVLNVGAFFLALGMVAALLNAGSGHGGGGGGGPRLALSGEQAKAVKAIESLGGEYEAEDERGKDVAFVSLSKTRATDNTLALVKSFPKLHTLELKDTPITDDGLAHLEGLRELQVLDLTGTKVTDAGLVHLKGLTKLEQLYVGNTKVTDAGIQQLKQALPKVEVSRQIPE